MGKESLRSQRGGGPAFAWRLLRWLKPLPVGVLGSGWGPQGVVLLLTTKGCKSGLPRVTPVQYELIEGEILLGAVRGLDADWVRNILNDPRVELRIGGRSMAGRARVSSDPEEIADFLETRLERHPFMVRGILLMHGLPLRPQRKDLRELGKDLALVRISTQESPESS